MIQIIPLRHIREVLPGDDLVEVLVEALSQQGIVPVARDVLVVTQKIVSKAENRFRDLSRVTTSEKARELAGITHKDERLVELVLGESAAVVRSVPHVLITRHRTGHVMANAGIDQSNIGPDGAGQVLLLPEDSDASAAAIMSGLAAHLSPTPAVVISDSFGRPWRYGVVNVAIGAAGLPALINRRGEEDRDGRRLEVTQTAFADLIASAAGLAMGEGAEGIPVALVRGLDWDAADAPAAAIVRPPNEDLFR